MAQGTRLTDDQVQAVAESFEVNPHWRAAANHAGVAERTLYEYRQRAETYTNRNADLSDETDPDWFHWQAVQTWTAARTRLEQRCAQGILDAGPKDWKAYQTILKALAPQDWSDRIELTGAGGGPVQVSSEELRAQIEEDLARIEAKRDAAEPPPAKLIADPDLLSDAP